MSRERLVQCASVALLLSVLSGCGQAPGPGGNASSSRSSSPIAKSSAPLVSPSPPPSQTFNCSSQERPPARTNVAMAYMPNLGEAVLFGGAGSVDFLADTWTWRAGCWTLRQISVAPSPRTGMAMAYDPSRQMVVAFGGRTDPQLAIFSRETWLWDGKAWSLVSKNGPDLGFAWAAFDENLKRVLLYGSANGGIAQTWTWDGSHWHQEGGSSPPRRASTAMAFDPSSHRVLLFGGLGEEAMTPLNDTWAWNGSVWSELKPVHSPSLRMSQVMASFTAMRQVLLFGGFLRGQLLGDAWLWDGSDWTQTSGTLPRADATAVDIGSGVLVFGGDDALSMKNDSLLWDGSKWTAI